MCDEKIVVKIIDKVGKHGETFALHDNERTEHNLNILDFKLTDDEMAEIAKLNKGVRYYTRTDEALAGFAAFQPTYEEA